MNVKFLVFNDSRSRDRYSDDFVEETGRLPKRGETHKSIRGKYEVVDVREQTRIGIPIVKLKKSG